MARSSKNPIIFILLPMQTLLLSNLLNLPPSNSQIFDQKTDGRFCYVCGRTNHMAPQCFNRKKEPAKAQQRGNGGNGIQGQYGGTELQLL